MHAIACAQAEDWRLLIYLAADNDLRARALENLEAFCAWSSAGPAAGGLEIYVHADIAGEPTRVLRFARGVSEVLRTETNANAGAGDVLHDFVATYGAPTHTRRVGLVIWNHGGGWELIAQDQPTGDHLDIGELKEAIGAAMAGRRLDLLGCDACLMSMVEVAQALREVATIFVASEGLARAGGWPYAALFDLLDSGGATPEGAARQVVRAFEQLHQHDPGFGTLSAISLAHVGYLSHALDALGDALIASDQRSLVQKARRRMIGLYNAAHVDLGSMVARLGDVFGECADHDTQAVLTVVREALARESLFVERARFGVESQRSGISVFFPERYLTPAVWRSYRDLTLVGDGGWSRFLAWAAELDGPSRSVARARAAE